MSSTGSLRPHQDHSAQGNGQSRDSLVTCFRTLNPKRKKNLNNPIHFIKENNTLKWIISLGDYELPLGKTNLILCLYFISEGMEPSCRKKITFLILLTHQNLTRSFLPLKQVF